MKTFSPDGVLARKESYSYTQSKEGSGSLPVRVFLFLKNPSRSNLFDDVAINPLLMF